MVVAPAVSTETMPLAGHVTRAVFFSSAAPVNRLFLAVSLRMAPLVALIALYRSSPFDIGLTDEVAEVIAYALLAGSLGFV